MQEPLFNVFSRLKESGDLSLLHKGGSISSSHVEYFKIANLYVEKRKRVRNLTPHVEGCLKDEIISETKLSKTTVYKAIRVMLK